MRIDRNEMCFNERIKMAFADTPVPVVIGSYGGGICELRFVFRIRNEKHVVEAVQSAWRINGESPSPNNSFNRYCHLVHRTAASQNRVLNSISESTNHCIKTWLSIAPLARQYECLAPFDLR